MPEVNGFPCTTYFYLCRHKLADVDCRILDDEIRSRPCSIFQISGHELAREDITQTIVHRINSLITQRDPDKDLIGFVAGKSNGLAMHSLVEPVFRGV